MKIGHIALLIIGVIAASLGILWFLQGSDLVHIKPILCFANCQPLVGKSPQWQYTGVITFIIGVVLAGVALKRIRR
jgi:hypothetical protein